MAVKKISKLTFTAFDSARQFEAENGSSKHSLEINKLTNDLSVEAVNKAIDENQNENFAEAADLLILVYNIDKEKFRLFVLCCFQCGKWQGL